MRRAGARGLLLCAVLGVLSPPQPVEGQGATLVWGRCPVFESTAPSRCGTFTVPEDPAVPEGRTLALRVIVHLARQPASRAAPLFLLAGGPGQTITDAAPRLATSPLREHHDLVLLDQRGTSAQMRLDCELAGTPDDPQGYLDQTFDPKVFARCRDDLSKRADLRFYSSELAADDVDALRQALGASSMNLSGTSYGTRLALEIIRRHPDRVRAAYLVSPLPIANRNPLFHARSAQSALDSLVRDCERELKCREAYPTLRAELDSLVGRLRRAAAVTQVTPPDGARSVAVRLSLENVGEALRTLMYQESNGPLIPRLIHGAYLGNYAELAQHALASNRRLRGSLRLGMLQSVICGEDVPRIAEAEIAEATARTMLGESRVRTQMAACNGWPRSRISPGFGEPVRSSTVPVLVVSGTRDPVTPAPWGEETARHFARGRHIVVPGGHGPSGSCLTSIAAEFFERADALAVDASCTAGMRYPDLAPPSAKR
ncbi:MAG: alpha/beta fold hydrolase [Gemmatimonadales bacterium]|nr:alpha/beta fold hydrolase [Gemmatimonadales bacterium]